MPRAKTMLQSEYPYHVSARCINSEWFELPLEYVWEVMSNQLHFINCAYGVRIHAFVLMNNHFHLILHTPDANLSECMAWFMRETSRSLTRGSGRRNQTYGGRHFRSIINSDLYFCHAYKYLYANPLRAGIVTRAEDYRFSSLPGLLGRCRLGFAVQNDEMLFPNFANTLDWINRPPADGDWEAVRKALRRSEFKLPKIRGVGHPLEVSEL